MNASWVDRYRAGERRQVWWELRQLGAAVRSPDLIDDARAVCDEMAHRALFNIETLVVRLAAQGFRAHSNDDNRESVEPFRLAGDGVSAMLGELEVRYGPLPLVMSSWMRIVGDVWLVGTHPEWDDADAADPLVIELEGARYPNKSMLDYWASEYDVWDELRETDMDMGGFVLPVAPDRLHKANISGGAPYGFRLPDDCADAVFVAESATSFVSYLNTVFTHGGFPGTSSSADAVRVKRSLSDGLLAL